MNSSFRASVAERVGVAEMPELERYVLHLLHALDRELRDAAEAFEFNRYIRALTDFANEDLSAFFFDIRKDSLYCDAADSVTPIWCHSPGSAWQKACTAACG